MCPLLVDNDPWAISISPAELRTSILRRMRRPLPPLPPDTLWTYGPRPGDPEFLMVRGHVVASLWQDRDGRWVSRVGLLWSDRLHRQAKAANARLAKRRVHQWLKAQMPRIDRARPPGPDYRAVRGNPLPAENPGGNSAQPFSGL